MVSRTLLIPRWFGSKWPRTRETGVHRPATHSSWLVRLIVVGSAVSSALSIKPKPGDKRVHLFSS